MERRSFLTGAAVGVAAGAAGVAAYNASMKKEGAQDVAAPAVSKGTRTMTIVSTWPRDFPGLGISAQRFASRVNEISDGAIQTEYFAAGERVGAFDSFDEVSSGNANAYIGADYYWTGKHAGFAYFTSVPFGMTTQEWSAWIKFGGGQELWDELSGEFGLKKLPVGSTGTQAGGWFNKEIESPDDFKGLKMRMPGLGGQVITKMGASSVSLPGGQIYENLVSGAIEATEWVGPYNDYFMKFYEAAKYYYTGGMHEPGGGLALGLNASWWGSLSDYERAVITAAAHEEHAAAHDEAMAKNGQYLQKLIDEQGIQVRSFNESVWDGFAEGAEAVFEETRDHSAMAAKIDDNFQAKLREIGGSIASFEGQFVTQRNRILGLG